MSKAREHVRRNPLCYCGHFVSAHSVKRRPNARLGDFLGCAECLCPTFRIWEVPPADVRLAAPEPAAQTNEPDPAVEVGPNGDFVAGCLR